MWIDPGPNPDLQGERRARNCLGHAIPAITKCHILKLTLCFESSRFGTRWKELQNILWTFVSSGMWRYVTAAWPWRWRQYSPSKPRTPQATPLCEPQTVVQFRTSCLLHSTGRKTRHLTYEWVSLQLAHGNGHSVNGDIQRSDAHPKKFGFLRGPRRTDLLRCDWNHTQGCTNCHMIIFTHRPWAYWTETEICQVSSLPWAGDGVFKFVS